MRISNVRIENFRSLKAFETTLMKFSVIIGENDVGKTSILHALKAFFESSKLSSKLDYFNGITDAPVEVELTIEDVGDHPLSLQLGTPGKIKVKRVFDFNSEPKTYGIKADDETVSIKKSEYKDVLGIDAFHFVPVRRSLDEQFSMKKTALLGKTLRALMKEKLAETKDNSLVTLQDSLRDAINPAKDELQKLIQEQLNNPALKLNFADLEIDPVEGVSFDVTVDDDRVKDIPLDQRGAGTQNAIIVALYRFIATHTTGNFILALEEPENSFHPKGQRELLAALLRLSATSQVICTTHSPVFIDIVDFRSNVVLVRQLDGTTIPKTLNPERISEVRQILGIRPSDALLKGGGNCAILVEGQSEEMAFPRFMKLAGVDDRTLGISVLPLRRRDVDTIMSYVKLLNSFDLPCCLILDGDVPGPERDNLQRQLKSGAYPALRFVHYLKDGCLEDYYPEDLICECLLREPLGGVNLKPDLLPHGYKCKQRVQAICKMLFEMDKPLSPERFKDELALFIPDRMVEKQVSLCAELQTLFKQVSVIASQQ